MKEKSYEFDPCSIDSSDNQEVTLDNWKPSTKQPHLISSKWRQEQINGNYNQAPGIDEVNKIKTALKKKYPDHEIMQAYGVNSQTLTAIKEGRYHPTTGVKFDNPTKVFNEFKRMENKLYGIKCAFEYLSQIIFMDKKEQRQFLQILNKKVSINEQFEEQDEEE